MQQVHINRLGVNSIEFESDIVEIPLSPGGEYSCEMVLINYSSPTNIHLSVSESLKENITFLDDNPYVRHEEYVPVIVRIPPGGRLFNEGEVFITVGYGSRTEGFPVSVGTQGPGDLSSGVEVDERLYLPSTGNEHVPKGKENNVSEQLSRISSNLLEGIHELVTPRFAVVIAGLFALLILLYVALSLIPTGFKLSLGFYPAVIISIIFTASILYLLTKISSFK